jgi:phosphoribosylamine--glycine ligase
MNILLIGGGGREHAIAKKIKESHRLNNFYCIPGNPGIAEIAKIVNIAQDDYKSIVQFAKDNKIDLIVCGPEKPLVDGLADLAFKNNISTFGPKSESAKLEGSKLFAKQFMVKYNVPTASFISFTDYEEAKNHLEKRLTFPVVIKADGLAAGKGVKIAKNKKEALDITKQYMVTKTLGNAGDTVVFEELLIGEEMSFLYITDGKTFLPLIPAKDYKKAFDGDMGDNTGGMGSYAPHTSITNSLKEKIDDEIINKIKDGFKKEEFDFKGVLYVGLMLTEDGPKVLEFNCRFGDPETQVILPLIENDLLEIFYAAAKGKLESHTIKWKNDYAACVVIASGGYPDKYKKGIKIKFNTSPFEFIHAGTIYNGKNILTNGGRVLNAVALGGSKSTALSNAYNLAKQVHFDKSFYRKDIGK